jgi:excisionase family DNA binding protein
MPKLFTVGQVARRLHLSEDTVRALADDGEIASQRTAGGHRRFTEVAVARYEARQGSSARRKKQAAPKRQPAKATAVPHVDDYADEDEEIFDEFDELPEDDVPALPVAQVRPPARSPAPRAESVRDHRQEDEEARRRQTASEVSRLQALKAYGTSSIPYDVPVTVRSKIVEELEAYVTNARLPAWVSSWEQQSLVKGRVDAIVEAHRKQVREEAEKAATEEARKVATETARKAAAGAAAKTKAEDERRVQDLISHGKRYAEDALREFEAFDRWKVRSQIEKALQEEVEADWSERDVEDLVDEELDEWEVEEE